MNLKILLPFKILATLADVSRIIADTLEGSIGLLPHRLDCVAALVPGILTYTTGKNDTCYMALDQGVLIKRGEDVLIAVRRGIAGTGLNELHQTVIREFLTLDGQERESRSVVAKMESTLIGRLVELHRER